MRRNQPGRLAAGKAWAGEGTHDYDPPAMRALRSWLVLIAVLSQTGRAGELPDPLFWASEADFFRQVDEGQFVKRLELHLLQYSADPDWRAEWAASRYVDNGLFGEFGSTTGSEMYVNSGIALNVFASERFQFRYDRRDYEDGRFELADERFDVAWHSGRSWGLVLTTWPTFDKERWAFGLGFRLGAARSRNALEVRVVDDAVVWNEKTDLDVELTSRPIRVVVDGYRESGPWRLRGSADLGLPWEAVEGASAAAPEGRSARGFQRFADLEAEYLGAGWAAALRLTGAALEKSQAGGTDAPMALERSWGRATASFRRDLGKWSVSALAGWASQRDDYSSPSEPAGAYASDALLLGVEGGLRAGRSLRLHLGLLGSLEESERKATEGGPLPPRLEDDYLDKAHLRATWVFRPRMSVELLLSQALSGGSFGGGSIKALLVF